MGWFDAGAPYLYVVCGLVVMLVSWPTAASGRRVLRRWGTIADPSDEQTAMVVRYLRERRLLVLPLMLLAPLTADVVSPGSDLGLYHLFGSLLIAWLLAEVLAGLRPVRGSIRTATLTRRRWQDLLPRWAIGLHVGLTSLAVGLAIVGLLAQPWANAIQGASTVAVHQVYRDAIAQPVGWQLIVAALVCALMVFGVGWLAVVRRAGADEGVDAALRIRSARVACGTGMLVASVLAGAAAGRLTFLVSMTTDIGPAPDWLQLAAPVAQWLTVAGAVLGLWGWSGMISAPRRPNVRTAG